MIERFEIIDHDSQRPDADHIIFCDGTGGAIFQLESDLELSHWRPNHTPSRYLAGTSTEICFRFLDQPASGSWTIAVNNHLDVDGILSVYVLTNSDHALSHRRTIIEAAEMGDFWGWGEPPAQRLFQGLTLLMNERREAGAEPRLIYEESFNRIPSLIDGTHPDCPAIDASLESLRVGVKLVEQGKIRRSLINPRLAHYVFDSSVIRGDIGRADHVPEFNEAISSHGFLWPQVRARWDSQRLSLVSCGGSYGGSHDLWFPGYLWADTEGLWQVPGLIYHDGMGSYDLCNARLVAAFEVLQHREREPGQWALAGTKLPFGTELQKRFPLGGRFVGQYGQPAFSGLSPDRVARVLEDVFV